MMDTSEGGNSVKLGCAIKQVDEKHASSDMREMIWSPKMDLVIAITSSEPNDIVLYRLHALKKMWTFSPPTEGAKVTSVAWDPMGKCLAVAYDSQQVVILAVEKAGVLFIHKLDTIPIKLQWIAIDKSVNDQSSFLYKDISNKMLPTIPKVNREDESQPSVDQINHDTLNYLIISCEKAVVNIYVQGLLSIAYIDLQTHCSKACRIISSCLSASGSHLVSVAEDEDSNLHLLSLDTEVLSERNGEIRVIADKFVHLTSLQVQCECSVTKMLESWEEGLLELDSKLNHFATQKQLIGEGTVLNDFLELLSFGTPSEELKVLLSKDLTERVMKKLGFALQTYYRTMQQLLSINMQGAVESMFYHLNDLHGLSQWNDTFGVIGMSTEHLQTAIQACGSLRLKINEILHLLSTGNRNLRAFSGWLYTVMLRINDQPVPEAAIDFDFSAVAEFLNENFKGIEENGSHIRLERVGQYLKDCDLTQPIKATDKSLWTSIGKFPQLAESKLLFKAEPTKSLYQLHKRLGLQMQEALSTPSVSIIKKMKPGAHKVLAEKCKVHRIKQFVAQTDEAASYIYTIRLSEMEGDNSRLRLVTTRLCTSNGIDL